MTSKLIVIKIGTSSLLENNGDAQTVRIGNVGQLVQLVSALKNEGHQVIMISSGAVGLGRMKLGFKTRPQAVEVKQAAAATGQSRLMRLYEDLFEVCNHKVAQLLLTNEDINDKPRFLNIKNTINALLKLDVIPIINENDVVRAFAVRFAQIGDNDCLASIISVQMNADWMFLLTDVDSLYTENPSINPNAQPILEVRSLDDLNVNTSTKGTDYGTGGMGSKLAAMRTCQCAGIHGALVNGCFPHRVLAYLRDDGERVGTYFVPHQVSQTIRDQRRWILSLPIQGTIFVDAGAARAVSQRKSLFASGILSVEGTFFAGEACLIALQDTKTEIARAQVNYSSEEVGLIKGLKSDEYASALNVDQDDTATEVCHRRNIIFSGDSDCDSRGPENDSEHEAPCRIALKARRTGWRSAQRCEAKPCFSRSMTCYVPRRGDCRKGKLAPQGKENHGLLV